MQLVWPALVTQNRQRHLLTAGMGAVMTEVMMTEVITARTTEVTTVMTAEITETNKI